MELTPRLSKIAELIPANSTVADVGTDHAYIPVYCFLNGISKHAIAMDLNSGPLQRAKANLKKYNVSHLAELRLSDGLEKLLPGEADVIVIAGMGGLLISSILKNGTNVIDDNTLLLLQPMNASVELRQFLFGNGYSIEDEYVVREEHKFYNIFAVKKGKGNSSDKNLYIGKNIEFNSPETVRAYVEYKIKVCEKIVMGMSASDNPDENVLNKNRSEIELYKSFLKELNNSDNN